MSNKKSQIIVFLVIILLVILGGYYLYNKNSNTTVDNPKPEEQISDLAKYFSNKQLIEQVDKNLSPETKTRFEEALEQYIELQEDENNKYQGFMGEATTYMQLGDYKTSLEKLKAMEEMYPEDELVSMNMGDLYMKMEQYLDAAYAMHAATEKKPDELLTHLRLAELYEKYASDSLEAEKIYKQALSDTSGHIEILKAYTTFLENIKKDYAAARLIWLDILNIEPDENMKQAIEIKIKELEAKIGE